MWSSWMTTAGDWNTPTLSFSISHFCFSQCTNHFLPPQTASSTQPVEIWPPNSSDSDLIDLPPEVAWDPLHLVEGQKPPGLAKLGEHAYLQPITRLQLNHTSRSSISKKRGLGTLADRTVPMHCTVLLNSILKASEAQSGPLHGSLGILHPHLSDILHPQIFLLTLGWQEWVSHSRILPWSIASYLEPFFFSLSVLTSKRARPFFIQCCCIQAISGTTLASIRDSCSLTT